MPEVEVLRLAAFTDDPEGGNPAGLVMDASELTDEQMQALAAEVGYSETAFLFPDPDSDTEFSVRYFSPVKEVDFCGHATIAAGVVLGRTHGDGVYELSTNVGLVPVDVTVAGPNVVATLTSPEVATEPLDEDVLDALLAALDWEFDDLDPRFPPTLANAGTNHPVLVAGSRHRLSALDYEWDDLADLMDEQEWLTIQIVFPKEGDPNQRLWFSRNPNPSNGTYESPATGSAAAALGGFFRDYGVYGKGDHLTIMQGDDMGRPSTILLTLAGNVMRITGSAVNL